MYVWMTAFAVAGGRPDHTASVKVSTATTWLT